MKNEFSPSWITCLDESMSKWLNQYTCPGFMVVPRKPWKCGNEYHTICCCLTGILFALELVEGKDRPTRAPPKEHKEKGKTVGLCLRLTKALQGSGSIVVMDSGFCVVKAIVELRKIGIFSHALIKNEDIGLNTLKVKKSRLIFKIRTLDTSMLSRPSTTV